MMRVVGSIDYYEHLMGTPGGDNASPARRLPVGEAARASLRRLGGRARALEVYNDLVATGRVQPGSYNAVSNALNRDKSIRRVGRGLYEFVNPVSANLGSERVVITSGPTGTGLAAAGGVRVIGSASFSGNKPSQLEGAS